MVCAVSGGADSLALLVLAVHAGLDVTAIHVDHGLRRGSAAEAGQVAKIAYALGASFEARSVTVPAGPNLEARARLARYAALPPGVLTGHTADDQAETMLLNLIRGAGLDGLAAMVAPSAAGTTDGRGGERPPPCRPLLALRRAETAALCHALGLTPLDDPSNRDPHYRRNRIRAEVLPLLAAVAERDLVPILARQAELFADDAGLLDELAASIDPTDAKALAAAPPALARRAVRRWLRQADNRLDDERHPPSAAEVERVLAVARNETIACELAGGRRVSRTHNRLRLESVTG